MQERDLEVELGDDYILDLQSKKSYCFTYQNVTENLENVNGHIFTVLIFWFWFF